MTTEKFKRKLESWLKIIFDEPKIENYTKITAKNDSIIQKARHEMSNKVEVKRNTIVKPASSAVNTIF